MGSGGAPTGVLTYRSRPGPHELGLSVFRFAGTAAGAPRVFSQPLNCWHTPRAGHRLTARTSVSVICCETQTLIPCRREISELPLHDGGSIEVVEYAQTPDSRLGDGSRVRWGAHRHRRPRSICCSQGFPGLTGKRTADDCFCAGMSVRLAV